MRRPQSTVFGALLMGARSLSGVVFIIVAAWDWRSFAGSLALEDGSGAPLDDATTRAVVIVLLCVYGVALVFYLAVALFVFLGHNWARILAMTGATISILIAFADYWNNGVEITLRTTLASLTLDILVLLALSSTSARQYARRPRGRLAREGSRIDLPKPLGSGRGCNT
ncbi:hypothetical protein [Glaciibacter sp. 2TAF33]|uniref:hypothetical protein n=1 Tax=Glaciibacter sp. 2TAF33 TaxID=3233015 RepID=UPI003F8E736E